MTAISAASPLVAQNPLSQLHERQPQLADAIAQEAVTAERVQSHAQEESSRATAQQKLQARQVNQEDALYLPNGGRTDVSQGRATQIDLMS